MKPHDHYVRIFDPSERRNSGAYFWDSLRRELPGWSELEYEWIATSTFGDQIILTNNSPLHLGPAIYMHGPDVGGPRSSSALWLDNILYLGSSVDQWLARVQRFGDEYSIVPGEIDDFVDDSDEYRRIYRELNPGLPW